MAAQVRGYTSKKTELKRCKIITYNTSLKFILYTTAITKVHPTQYPHKQFKLNCIVTNVSIQPLSKTLHKLQKKNTSRKTSAVSTAYHHRHCPRSTLRTHFYSSKSLCPQNVHFCSLTFSVACF